MRLLIRVWATNFLTPDSSMAGTRAEIDGSRYGIVPMEHI
jgi:hypothetical protein